MWGYYAGLVLERDERTAEECVNDTWLKTWESIPPSEPRDYLYAFVARITRMLSLDCYRKENTKYCSGIVDLQKFFIYNRWDKFHSQKEGVNAYDGSSRCDERSSCIFVNQ